MNRKLIFLASFFGLSILVGACEPATQPPTTTRPAVPPTTPTPVVPPATPTTP
ncbi:beta-Ig-H3/fasciclin [Fortiea sp. LEGE XX443]|uniref:beta-Ig-H3/fasciclin n=1 Tax=Fortiea sp. LEGE XX443 TaxID=1828611 RepID=UPI001A0DC901|nr:beta-Ig-H3/fasciclin [Fortiea sp. LEGE XX443]